jgi:hypothetical protein
VLPGELGGKCPREREAGLEIGVEYHRLGAAIGCGRRSHEAGRRQQGDKSDGCWSLRDQLFLLLFIASCRR